MRSQVFREKINKAEEYEGGLVVWVENQYHALFMVNVELELWMQCELRINVKSIYQHFKLADGDGECLYFIGRTANGTADLFRLRHTRLDLVLPNIGLVDEVVPCKVEGRVCCVLLRRGGELFRLGLSNISERLIQIDL